MSPMISRRQFLGSTAAATALASVPHVHAAGSDVLRIGLIGCGGRGRGGRPSVVPIMIPSTTGAS